jgi:hypothetical protein
MRATVKKFCEYITYFEDLFRSSLRVCHDEFANIVSAVVVPLLLP